MVGAYGPSPAASVVPAEVRCCNRAGRSSSVHEWSVAPHAWRLLCCQAAALASSPSLTPSGPLSNPLRPSLALPHLKPPMARRSRALQDRAWSPERGGERGAEARAGGVASGGVGGGREEGAGTQAQCEGQRGSRCGRLWGRLPLKRLCIWLWTMSASAAGLAAALCVRRCPPKGVSGSGSFACNRLQWALPSATNAM